MKEYQFQDIEKKWQFRWEEKGIFKRDSRGSDKYYTLEMFPYPSGRIHMGHVRNYVLGDLIARARWLQGYNVLHPMGWDSFGLPAENAAIDRNIHPAQWTYDNIENMKRQLKRMGLSYDWDREIATCRPEYYRWEQLVFIKMFEKGLAYKKSAIVNWCPNDKTVLANEQVKEGKCERCRTEVETKEISSWYFKNSQYAEELLEGLKIIEQTWPERVITSQINWIGKSRGVEINFPLLEPIEDNKKITVFTTRPDTIYGVTFMSIAPEHPLALLLAHGKTQSKEIEEFVNRVRKEDKVKRGSEDYEKEGRFTGAYCINPLTNDKIPIFIANFVLPEYGTGAVMAVPAHDQRDFEFAKKYNLPLKVVIQPENKILETDKMTEAYTEDGYQVNSDKFNGIFNQDSMEKIIEHIEHLGYGNRAVNFRLKDWLVSRQRYWGCPIPIIYCEKCGTVTEKEENLPVILPEDVKITGKGGSPLANHPSFINTKCPKCNGPAKRESDTFDTFVESSWYFLRYISPEYRSGLVDKNQATKWMSVDQYIGGVEHSVGHLMFARFFYRVLRDLNFIEIKDKQYEPFIKLLTQGMVTKETQKCETHGWLYPEEVDEKGKCKSCGEPVINGRAEKMSKSLHNIVDPEKIINKYGADTARFFILSDSPPDRDLLWSTAGVEGAYTFLIKLWKMITEHIDLLTIKDFNVPDENNLSSDDRKLLQKVHQTVADVTGEIEGRYRFNTCIARIRELTNLLRESIDNNVKPSILKFATKNLLILFNPFVPHITEELWELLGGQKLLVETQWPAFDEKWLIKEKITLAVQINGKLRATIEVSFDALQKDVEDLVLNNPKIQNHISSSQIKKFVYVPGKIFNIIIAK